MEGMERARWGRAPRTTTRADKERCIVIGLNGARGKGWWMVTTEDCRGKWLDGTWLGRCKEKALGKG